MTIVTETFDDEFERSRAALQGGAIGCVLRLTAVTNAADALLRALSGEQADTDEQQAAQIVVARRDLTICIRVARGSAEKLPAHLFDSAADRQAARAAAEMGLL